MNEEEKKEHQLLMFLGWKYWGPVNYKYDADGNWTICQKYSKEDNILLLHQFKKDFWYGTGVLLQRHHNRKQLKKIGLDLEDEFLVFKAMISHACETTLPGVVC